MSGIRVACYRRPVAAQHLDQLVNEVEAVLIAHDGQEVSSSKIGDEVLSRLRNLDAVAYIRFASVYRSFADIVNLREAVEEVLNRENVESRVDADER